MFNFIVQFCNKDGKIVTIDVFDMKPKRELDSDYCQANYTQYSIGNEPKTSFLKIQATFKEIISN